MLIITVLPGFNKKLKDCHRDTETQRIHRVNVLWGRESNVTSEHGSRLCLLP